MSAWPTPLAGSDEPCMHCSQPPASGAWGKPCPDSPDKAHWTTWQRRLDAEHRLNETARSLSRAAYELDKLAAAVEELSPRTQRKLSIDLTPELIRNEAERARDILHAYGLLDA
jgi:hypothetical protein